MFTVRGYYVSSLRVHCQCSLSVFTHLLSQLNKFLQNKRVLLDTPTTTHLTDDDTSDRWQTHVPDQVCVVAICLLLLSSE